MQHLELAGAIVGARARVGTELWLVKELVQEQELELELKLVQKLGLHLQLATIA